MPFHVEISVGMRRARSFNLGADELRRAILEPWLEDRPVELGDREWQPRKSDLKVLEGPLLENTDLAFGQGWANAERSAENVTVGVLASARADARESAPTALMVEAESADEALEQLAGGREALPLEWAQARKMIDGRDPKVAAVIVVLRREP